MALCSPHGVYQLVRSRHSRHHILKLPHRAFAQHNLADIAVQ